MKLILHDIPHTCSKIIMNLMSIRNCKFDIYNQTSLNINNDYDYQYVIIRDPLERYYKEFFDYKNAYLLNKQIKCSFDIEPNALQSINLYMGYECTCNVFCKSLMLYKDFNVKFTEEDYQKLITKIRDEKIIFDIYSKCIDFKNLEKLLNIEFKKMLPNYDNTLRKIKIYENQKPLFLDQSFVINFEIANSYDLKLFKELKSIQ